MLKKLRIKNNLTQKELSQKANVNLRTLQDYEQHRRKLSHANVTTISNLSKVLNVEIEDLIKEPERKTIYYYDHENIHMKGLYGIEKVKKQDEIIFFFYTQYSYQMTKELKLLLSSEDIKCKITKIKQEVHTKNAMDLKIVTDIGMRIGKGENNNYVIISNDKGYDASIQYLKGKYKDLNIKRCQNIEDRKQEYTKDEIKNIVIDSTKDIIKGNENSYNFITSLIWKNKKPYRETLNCQLSKEIANKVYNKTKLIYKIREIEKGENKNGIKRVTDKK